MRGLSYDSMFREEPKRVILMHLQFVTTTAVNSAGQNNKFNIKKFINISNFKFNKHFANRMSLGHRTQLNVYKTS